jgi:hypothetical protein
LKIRIRERISDYKMEIEKLKEKIAEFEAKKEPSKLELLMIKNWKRSIKILENNGK